ncbi:MAG: urate hydroxylase PuuD [Myxococcales bacterium]|nr:urate hydroxylase PuuD [Myxococcales bacterium]
MRPPTTVTARSASSPSGPRVRRLRRVKFIGCSRSRHVDPTPPEPYPRALCTHPPEVPLGDPWITDWLHLLARWFHLVVGAAWIGASFYFNWLNNNIRPMQDPSGRLAGGLWAVHGGAFYEVRKYKGAPETLPKTLHWFKWEAYLTWISGLTLLLFVYWLDAGLTMVNPDSGLGVGATTAIGVGALVVGWLVYDLLCKTPLVDKPGLGFVVAVLLLGGSAFGLAQVLSPRAAYIHFGAMMGTMMALNVFFVIIPGQRAMVDAMVNGQDPPLAKGRAGALRSLHNNYFTLPVLFIMVSNHFAFTYGHEWAWAVLVALSLIGAGVRHWFNLHGKGEKNAWILPAAAVAMVALAFVSHGPKAAPKPGAQVPSFAQIQVLLGKHCTQCHAAKPTFQGITAPPKGLLLTDPKVVQGNAALIKAQAVDAQIMPLGNLTGMTPEERALLGAWIDGGAPLE